MRGKFRLFRLFLNHMLPLLAVVLVLGIGAFLISLQSTQRTSYDNEVRLLEQLNLYYENIIAELDALNLIFSTNSQIADAVRAIVSTGEADYEDYRTYRLYQNLLTAFLTARPSLQRIWMYLPNDRGMILCDTGFLYLESLPDATWFISYMADSHGDRAEFSTARDAVRISRPIRNASGMIEGVLVLDIREGALIDAYLPFRSCGEESLLVETEEGMLLLEYPGTGNGKAVSFTSVSDTYHLRYTLSVPFNVLYASSFKILYLSLALCLLSLLMGLFLVYRTDKDERLFVSNVLSQLHKAGTTAELDEMEAGENLYLYLNDRILKTFIEKDYLRLQKEAAEYKALQLQINPHFLFNTLDTIYWKAVRLTGGENDTSLMVHDLSKLLKYSLRADPEAGALLSEEIDQVETYIGIQQVRFRDKFRFVRDYGELPSMRVPVFTLQPLIENCFNHGFVEGESLTITLSVTGGDGVVTIAVGDDGKGADEETLSRINDSRPGAMLASSSIGISNIRERLGLFFQGRASLKAGSGGERGFSVTITIRE